MQTALKLIPKLLFFMLGTGIVFISLFSANRVFSQGDDLELTHRKIYFQTEVLPDHLIYPVFMAFDKLRLEVASPHEAIRLQLLYGWRRLEYTEQLLADGYQGLSFSTLTKAYKYYNTGLAESQSLSLSLAERQAIKEDARHFQIRAKSLEASFNNTQQQELMRLEAEQEVLAQFFIDSL